MRRSLSLAALALTLTLIPALAPAAEPPPLTVETIFSRPFTDAVSTPEHAWLDDGTLLLLDKRVPAEGRTLELYEPTTATRRPACDAAKALASLRALLGEAAPTFLAWPDVVHPGGRTLLYLIDGDVFTLDVASSSFRRLTTTAVEEKCLSASPDGRQAAFVRENDLYVVDVASGKERRLTRDGSETVLNGTLSWVYWEEIFGRDDSATWWSPDGAAIAILQSDESRVDLSLFPEFEPATPKVQRQRYPKAGGANPTVRVGLIELASGKTRWVRLADPAPEYVMRVAWLPDSRRLAVQIADRLQRRLELVLVDRASGKTTTVLTETSPTSVTVSDDLTFVEGGRRFLWSSERDGRNHLYLYDIDGTLVRSLTPGEVVVRASSGVAWVRGGVVAVDEARHLVYFTASSGLPIAPALYRVSWDGGEVERVSRTQGTHRVAFDKATARFVDRVASFTTPPSLVLCGADGGEQAVITPPASEFLAPYRVQTPRFFTIPAADGFALPAQITTPRDFDPARRYPVIISVYGGPGAPTVLDDWQRDATFENVLLENGFVCMGIDPRSATGLSRTVQDTSYGKILAAYEVPDILAGVNWLRGQGWVDGERIGVWGWSGGGSTTLQLMTHSRAFKAGIAVAAVTDFRYYDTVYTESVMGLPKDNPEGYVAGAPATVAKDLSGRLLLVHGLYDDNVHPQNAWRFARELQKAGVIFEMMVYPLEKHGLRGVSTHVYGTMLEFWKRSL